MKVVHEWAEEHWAGVALAMSIAGAVVVAVILIVCFSVVTTR